jgi:hypothetical protein
MSRLCAFLICSLIALLPLTASASGLLASVDRTRLAVGESFELTLRTSDVTLFGRPDTAPLQAQFAVGDVRQVNDVASLADDHEPGTRWIITLVPRESGTLTLPGLALGELHSQPIVLQVLDAEAPSVPTTAPLFIEATLDQDQVYVQAQVILTLRVYHSVPLYDDSTFAPPDLPDARVQLLGNRRTYEKVINGVRHGVLETRYALYPQHSGSLSIPALPFTATTVDTDDSGKPRAGGQLRVRSAQMTVRVMAKPALYPADATWLPARSLSLADSWNPAPENTRVGDSLTRTLTVKAEGLSSAQLPPLPHAELTGLRRYPDQPQLSDQGTERGLLGTRQEREALVPMRAGDNDLPPVEVVWWNTREDHLERTSLPARTLHVADRIEAPIQAGPVIAPPAIRPIWPWQLSTAVFLATSLLGFGLWWRARSRPAVARLAATGPSPRSLLDDLKRACLNNNPQASRQALDAWARQQPETLAELAERYPPLSEALDGLNGALYSEAGRYWQGERLWLAVSGIPASGRHDPEAEDNLPPLYPK